MTKCPKCGGKIGPSGFPCLSFWTFDGVLADDGSVLPDKNWKPTSRFVQSPKCRVAELEQQLTRVMEENGRLKDELLSDHEAFVDLRRDHERFMQQLARVREERREAATILAAVRCWTISGCPVDADIDAFLARLDKEPVK